MSRRRGRWLWMVGVASRRPGIVSLVAPVSILVTLAAGWAIGLVLLSIARWRRRLVGVRTARRWPRWQRGMVVATMRMIAIIPRRGARPPVLLRISCLVRHPWYIAQGDWARQFGVLVAKYTCGGDAGTQACEVGRKFGREVQSSGQRFSGFWAPLVNSCASPSLY